MLKIGNVNLETPLLLAPIAGFCDLAFRLVVRQITGPAGGVGLACTDLLCPHALLRENEKSLWLAATCKADQPLCMQLYGVDADLLAQAARWAQAHGAAIIDINMGCPVDKVTKKNGGSKLLCDPVGTVQLAKKIVQSVDVPVTAKIRLGWDDDSLITDTLPTALADVGIAAVTVHGRTTAQKFSGKVCHQGIARVVKAMSRHHPNCPVIGNGDIKSPHDAKFMLDQTGCQGLMIGRGALGQPWIFRETAYYLQTGRLLDPLPQSARARCVLKHFQLLRQYRGDRIALNTMRQRIARYSPYLQPWPHLRKNVHDMQSVNALIDFMDRHIQGFQTHPS